MKSLKDAKIMKFASHVGVHLLGHVRTWVSIGNDGVEEISMQPMGIYVKQTWQGKLKELIVPYPNCHQIDLFPEEKE